MRKQTQRTNISPDVKKAVWERDKHRCIICGQYGEPVAHYIARSQGGKGTEYNIVTLCYICHHAYDQSEKRPLYGNYIRTYLRSKYPDWDEHNLIFRKEDQYAE